MEIENKLILNKNIDPNTLNKMPYSRVIDLIEEWQEELKVKQKQQEQEQKELDSQKSSFKYNPNQYKLPSPPKLK